MSVLSSILAFLIVFGIIVLVHEFGHFIAARLMGVRVEAFSFGFGKRLWGKKIGDTDYRLSLIPLGGFVKMAGEEEFDIEPEERKPDEFYSKNRGQRIFILIMGPLMNVLLSFIIFTIINLSGVEVPSYKGAPPVLNYVHKDSPAQKAGLLPGDTIKTIDGRDVPHWEELELMIGSNPNEKLNVQYERNGELKDTVMEINSTKEYNLGDAGIYWVTHIQINAVQSGLPADLAGLKADDVLLKVDGQLLYSFQFSDKISANAGKELVFTVQRGKETLDLKIIPQEKEVEGKKRGWIGVSVTDFVPKSLRQYGLFAAMGKSKDDMVRLSVFVFTAFRKMVAGKISAKNLSGPIEIAKFSSRAMERGPGSLFMLIAFISLQLGLVNLLPIPMLDGGHLLIYSIESVIRKDFSPKLKIILMNIGLLLLVGLMAFVLLNDVAKLLPNGWSSFWPF